MDPSASRTDHWRHVLKQNPALLDTLTPRLTKYIPVTLSVPQAIFLLRPERESLFGGAAGGGKSIALLAGSLQYVDVPGYAALLIRRTLKELSLPGGLMAVGHQWLVNSDARWDYDNKTWHFPNGATLTFGYLDSEADLERYQGSEYQYIGIDEAAQFEEERYTYLMSRLRKDNTIPVPLRMRLASNPGSIGGAWIKRRFMTEGMQVRPPRSFIPAKVTDNPFLDQASYIENLMQLSDPVKRAQLLYGDWDIVEEGEYFRGSWFQYTDLFPNIKYVRFWDLSAQTDTHKDADWTVGALVGLHDGRIYIKNIARMRGNPGQVESFVWATAQEDNRNGRKVTQYIEQEGGSSGVNTVFNYKNRVLKGFHCEGWRPKGNKIDRARLWSGYVQKKLCYLPENASWTREFLEEVQLFPTKRAHDDQVDAVSGAVTMLLQAPEPRVRYIELYHSMVSNAKALSAFRPATAETQSEAKAEIEAQEARLARLRKASKPKHLRGWD
jgi:predicted phage terminase large subunit-like protein